MKILDLQQGSREWIAHRAECLNASDAPAMAGVSPYKSRSDLIRERATGILQEYDAATLARFRAGHETEASIRPVIERIIGEDLFPVVGETEIDGMRLSASSDGLTMDCTIGFEHKIWNEGLAELVRNGVVPASHIWQVVHQHAVFGLEKTLFAVSDGTADKLAWCWVTVTQEQVDDLLAGWKQFQRDVAAWKPEPAAPVVVATDPGSLPAVFVQVEGRVVAGDMLAHRAMVSDWVKRLPARFETDQDFADGIAAVKACEKAEGDLKALAQQIRGQMATVDEVFRLIEDATKELATARLRIDKAVKAEKDRKRLEEVTRGREAFAAHWSGLNARVGGLMPGAPAGAWGDVIKGLKTIASIRDAIDTELARAKIEANEVADRIEANIRAMGDARHLFPDLAQVCTKPAEDFSNLLSARKANHERREAAKLEAERARIRAEEQAKAEREAQDKARLEQQAREAEMAAERARLAAAQKEAIRAALAAQPISPAGATPAVQPAVTNNTSSTSPDYSMLRGDGAAHETAPEAAATAPVAESVIDNGKTMKLGEICERLGFAITAQFLATLGFEPVSVERAARLYRACDYRSICTALVRHIETTMEG